MNTNISLLPALAGAAALLLVSGCASAPKYAPVSNIPSGRALIYFYGIPDGSFLQCRVDHDNKRLTTLQPGEYFVHLPQAGTNLYRMPNANGGGMIGFMIDQQAPEVVRIRTQPGRTYYMKGVGMNTIMRVDEATGSREIAECYLARPGDVSPDELPASAKG